MSSPREREKRDIEEEMKELEMGRKRNGDESEKKNRRNENTLPSSLPTTRIAGLAVLV